MTYDPRYDAFGALALGGVGATNMDQHQKVSMNLPTTISWKNKKKPNVLKS